MAAARPRARVVPPAPVARKGRWFGRRPARAPRAVPAHQRRPACVLSSDASATGCARARHGRHAEPHRNQTTASD